MDSIPGVALGDHGGGDARAGADLLIGCNIVHNGAPQTVFGLVELERGQLVVQAADNVQKLGVQVALRQPHTDLRHRVGSPRIGAPPLDTRHISVENQPYPVLCTLSPDGCTAHIPAFPKIVITAPTLDAALLEVKQQIQKALRQYKNPPIPTKQEQIVVPTNSVLVLVKAS
mgnify:CR=1 FL=1